MDRILQNLQIRGLSDDTLSLIVTDGNRGLEKAVDMVFPLVGRQRCWAHKMRNVASSIMEEIKNYEHNREGIQGSKTKDKDNELF